MAAEMEARKAAGKVAEVEAEMAVGEAEVAVGKIEKAATEFYSSGNCFPCESRSGRKYGISASRLRGCTSSSPASRVAAAIPGASQGRKGPEERLSSVSTSM